MSELTDAIDLVDKWQSEEPEFRWWDLSRLNNPPWAKNKRTGPRVFDATVGSADTYDQVSVSDESPARALLLAFEGLKAELVKDGPSPMDGL